MCCESCHKYERCEQESKLKDECCPKCSDYDDCAGMYNEYDKTDNEEEVN